MILNKYLMHVLNESKTRPALSLVFILYLLSADFKPIQAQVNAANFNNLLTEFESQKLNVKAIEQDDRGFIWFGTHQGLFRFDGVSYQRFLPEPGSNRSLSDQQVTTIFCDSKGSLWIGTRHGLNRYNYLSNDFEQFKHSRNDNHSIPSNEILAIAEDRNSNLWIGTWNGGLSKLSLQSSQNGINNSFTNFKYSDADSSGICSNIIFSIVFDETGHGLIGTDKGLNILMPAQETQARAVFKHFMHNAADKTSIGGNEVFKIFCDEDNNAWLISQFGMVDLLTADEISNHTFRFKHILPSIKELTKGAIKSTSQIYIDHQRNCWLTTYENGLYRFKIASAYQITSLVNYVHDPADSRSLSDNNVSAVFESADGCFWVGTAAGVSRWNPLQEKFSSPLTAAAHFKNSNINGIAEDAAGNIWVGTSDSDTLFVIDAGKNTLKRLVLEDKKNSADRKIYVTSLIISGSGDLYAGTSYGIFILAAAEKEKFMKVRGYKPALLHLLHDASPNSLFSNMLICLDEDENGKIWMGTGKGLNRYDPETGTCERIYPNGSSSQMNTAYIIRHIHTAKDGDVWLATDEGLITLPASNYSSAIPLVAQQSRLTNIRFSFIHEGSDANTMWLGSQQGLYSLNRKTGAFNSYQSAGTDLSVMAIVEDAHQNLWISSQQGICRFNPTTGDIKKFTAQNGLNANWFSETTYFESHDGRFYFGSQKGFQVFHPDSITVNESSPPVVITDLKLFNQSILQTNDHRLKTQFLGSGLLQLNYDQNFFSIDFAALSYEDAYANNYVYQLVDIDKDWVQAGNNRTATYTNIAPGNYVFKVKGSNNHGIWNETGATLQIVISPPWWQTWWFYTVCFIAVISALYALYQYRINQIKKVFTIRSKIARDLHDDIGSTLSSISLMSQLAKTGGTDKNKEASLFETISTASKEAMELMSVIVWSVNPNNDKLSNILIRMREYASDTLEACNIEISIKLEEDARDLTIPMEKRKDFFLIFKEAVNNMAKYSGAKNGCIHLLKENNKMIMAITDDGHGFDTEKLRSGNGLLNMKERAKSIGGVLQITSEAGKGTTIRLELPNTS